nr:MAG TPA: hypothetical protein [Caudoviricetes sp.]
MIIHINITQTEVNVLKKALRTYPKQKKLTNDLIGLIEYQEEKQRGKANKKQETC